MNGSTGPPSDVTAMGSENDEGGSSSKVRRGAEDSTAATASSSSPSGSAAPYPILQTDQPEYRGQGSIRADSASPLPTTSSSSSSSSSLSSSSSPPPSPSPLPPPPPPPPGCGCIAATVLEPDEITISITPTTGGQFDLTVDRTDTVENLKKIISKRLKVAKERICLLHRERLLREGTLEENRLQDGSRLTLLPSVETGLLTQRPEQSVMQALESLNDSQVNDFLSGKAPLNLTMRFGDHLMLIQLQLSTVTHVLPTAGLLPNGSSLPTSHVSTSLQSRRSTVPAARATASASPKLQNDSAAARTSSLMSSLASALRAAVSCSTSLSTATTTTSPVCSSRATTASSVSSTSYSPISPPHSSFCTSQSQSSRTSNHGSVSPTSNSSACQSCLLYHHHHQHHSRYHHHHHSRYHHHHRHHHLHHSRNKPTTSWTTSQSSSTADHLQQSTSTGHGCSDSVPYDATPPRKKLCIAHHHNQQSTSGTDASRSTAADGDTRPQSPTSSLVDQSSKTATLDTRALAEASRNLTQKLKQLSSEVLTSRVDLAEENVRRRHGAILEGMHRHGKGVYSGTFSGTLKPALQDPHGRPKRDISTIVHILNDLICATPSTEGHYRYHYRFVNDRQQSSTSTSTTGTTTTTNGATTPTGCRDSSTPGYSTEELSKENEATKGKMRRLRLVMEQRRAKRKARRQARAAPYTTQWAAVTPDPDPNHDPNTSTASSSAGAPNTTEPQNEPELQPCSPEPVVA